MIIAQLLLAAFLIQLLLQLRHVEQGRYFRAYLPADADTIVRPEVLANERLPHITFVNLLQLLQ